MDVDQIIDETGEIIGAFLKKSKADFKEKMVELRPAIAEFVASGRVDHLRVVQFRLRTWARSHAVKAVRAKEKAIVNGVGRILEMAIAAI